MRGSRDQRLRRRNLLLQFLENIGHFNGDDVIPEPFELRLEMLYRRSHINAHGRHEAEKDFGKVDASKSSTQFNLLHVNEMLVCYLQSMKDDFA